MRSVVWLSFAALVATLGCDEAVSNELELPALRKSNDPLDAPSRRMAIRKRLVEKRLKRRFELGKRPKLRRCDEITESTDFEVTTSDARIIKKHLLPLRLTKHLSTHPLARLSQFYRSKPGSSWYKLLRSADAQKGASVILDRLENQDYIGVYHIVDFRPPRRFIKLGHAKAQWSRGYLTAWFALHDLDTGSAACQVRVHLIETAEGAPLSRRLREETTKNLVEKMGRRMRLDTAKSLAKISPHLVMPPLD